MQYFFFFLHYDPQKHYNIQYGPLIGKNILNQIFHDIIMCMIYK